MRSIHNWEERKRRLAGVWGRERLDRCCLCATAPLGEYAHEPLPETPEGRARFWTDAPSVHKRFLKSLDRTYFAGDAFPLFNLNLGAAGHAGFFRGARYEFEHSVWFHPMEYRSDEGFPFFDRQSFLFRKTLEFARYFSAEARGDYLVSMPDISGNLDALAHLTGSDELMLMMLSEPDFVLECLGKIQAAWRHTIGEVYGLTKENNEGAACIGWMPTWAPGKHAQLQCDMSVMLSPGLFNAFALPEMKDQIAFLDHSTYHFDGVEQLRNLDTLLSLEGLGMIQWTCVKGQPPALSCLDDLRKIQRAGKSLLIIVNPDEVEPLLRELSACGLQLVVPARSREQADELVRTAYRCSKWF